MLCCKLLTCSSCWRRGRIDPVAEISLTRSDSSRTTTFAGFVLILRWVSLASARGSIQHWRQQLCKMANLMKSLWIEREPSLKCSGRKAAKSCFMASLLAKSWRSGRAGSLEMRKRRGCQGAKGCGVKSGTSYREAGLGKIDCPQVPALVGFHDSRQKLSLISTFQRCTAPPPR